MARIWAGTDIGKTHHHCVVLDAEGKRLLSRRVPNDEPDLLALLAEVLALDEDVVWAVDVADGMAALLIHLLLNHGQQLVYIPGLAVNRAAAGYRGTGKTDAKDATVIADQARMRRDLTVLHPDDEHAIELRVLTSRRSDLTADRTRSVNRLRAMGGGRCRRRGHRPRRYHRGLQRVFYQSALVSVRTCEESRRFYQRKRAEGKRHTQAILALARRRVNVLWALIRDRQCYQRTLPVTTVV
ncbi:IS110 family transposase [Streptomyces sp.]|uniref:IS110 family transposase n=1 Tax=Streptomyces sp. TaxID=1931 RepID=UPI002D78000E|nr:IS110 family transposase [Streptomyces sp.]HET6357112.1 IS110 family transposase [Streptomyces sp.]